MSVAFRAITYATLFIAFLLVYLPSRVLLWSGIIRPSAMQAPQIAGIIIASIGAAIALWCVVTFVRIGKALPHHSTRRAAWSSAAPTASFAIRCTSAAHSPWPGPCSSTARSSCSPTDASFCSPPASSCSFTRNPPSAAPSPDYEAYCHRVSRWWPRV